MKSILRKYGFEILPPSHMEQPCLPALLLETLAEVTLALDLPGYVFSAEGVNHRGLAFSLKVDAN